MHKEVRSLISVLIKNIMVTMIILILVTIIIGHAILGLIFILGLLVATINFILSGIILDVVTNSKKKIVRYIFPISYILRIITVIIIAYPFIYNKKYILAYILGFISFFIVLVISWIKKDKGVSEWSHTKL